MFHAGTLFNFAEATGAADTNCMDPDLPGNLPPDEVH